MSTSEWIVDRAVLPHAVLAGVRVVATGGVVTAIEQVTHTTSAPRAERLAGTLLPGFVDLQVNGAGGHSVDEATPQALDAVAAAVHAGGAVAFLPTLITAPWPRLLEQVRAVAAWIDAYDGDGATPLGLHLEGPFLTAPGAHDAEHFVDPTPQRLQELLSAGGRHLRLVTLAHARPMATDAIATLTAHGVTCALGHCATTEGLAECVAAGAAAVTHLFNVMGPLHHRDVGVAGFALDDARLSCPLIVDGVHVHPAMLRNAFAILGPDRTILVTDAVAAAGMPDGDYSLSGMRVSARDGVVRDEQGNLAGSALTMALAARNFLRMVPKAGVWTIGRVAAGNPARLLREQQFGEIAVGKRAAFTLLGDDGSCRAIVPRSR